MCDKPIRADYEYHLQQLRNLYEQQAKDAEYFRWYFGWAKTAQQTQFLAQAMQPIPGGTAPNVEAWRQIISQVMAMKS
jgi:hypothetical protein